MDTKKIYKALDRAIRMRNAYYERMMAHDDMLSALHTESLMERAYAKDMWLFWSKKVRFVSAMLPQKALFNLERANLGG